VLAIAITLLVLDLHTGEHAGQVGLVAPLTALGFVVVMPIFYAATAEGLRSRRPARPDPQWPAGEGGQELARGSAEPAAVTGPVWLIRRGGVGPAPSRILPDGWSGPPAVRASRAESAVQMRAVHELGDRHWGVPPRIPGAGEPGRLGAPAVLSATSVVPSPQPGPGIAAQRACRGLLDGYRNCPGVSLP
jgi:hypothetical protein